MDAKILIQLAEPAPRYTSYPTAPNWAPLDSTIYVEKLKKLATIDTPCGLYFHIPFCHSMCLYCGCSVVLNRKQENEERYVEALIKEMQLVTSYVGKKKVSEVHFGGGTPTKLSSSLLQKLMLHIDRFFDYDPKGLSIEVDPRTVYEDQGEKLIFLRELGFHRISFGVQDTNEKVQEAVKRRQSVEMTRTTYTLARTLGFTSINIDLIYGLPLQTALTFQETVREILEMRPDRIALFSYAHVPWLKGHQKALKETTLPTTEEKFEIYQQARKAFVQAGYVAIGMDHFALATDEMALAYHNKTLQRNFQGYTASTVTDLMSFGITSIGFAENLYIQNIKELPTYYQLLDQGILPIHRGHLLSEEDHLRKWVIHTLMCTFELEKEVFLKKFHIEFDLYFRETLPLLERHIERGFLIHTPDKITITPLGELVVRSIVMIFDAYLTSLCPKLQFSNAI